MASSSDEPLPRQLHSAVQVEENTYLWGGLTRESSDSSRREVINIFDSRTEIWKERNTAGVPPPGHYYGSFAMVCGDLYYFGARDGNTLYNSVHKLRLSKRTLKWKKIVESNPARGPLPKTGCGMVAYQQQLALIGGFSSPPNGRLQSGAKFIRSQSYPWCGYTNEFHLLSIEGGMRISL